MHRIGMTMAGCSSDPMQAIIYFQQPCTLWIGLYTRACEALNRIDNGATNRTPSNAM